MWRMAFAALSASPFQPRQRSAEAMAFTRRPRPGFWSIVPRRSGIAMRAAGHRVVAPYIRKPGSLPGRTAASSTFTSFRSKLAREERTEDVNHPSSAGV